MAKKFIFKPLADFPDLKPEDHHKYYVKGKTVRVTKAGLPWKKTIRTTADEKIKVSTFDKEEKKPADDKVVSTVVLPGDDLESNLTFLASTISIIVNTLACSFCGPDVGMSPAEMKVTTAANKNYLKTLEADALSPEIVLLLAYSPIIAKCATSEKMKKRFSRDEPGPDPVTEIYKKKPANESGQDGELYHGAVAAEVLTKVTQANKGPRKGKK